MKLKLACPYASYGQDMKIKCSKAEGLCGHQRFRICKGWSELTEAAETCPLRKENANVGKKKASKKRAN